MKHCLIVVGDALASLRRMPAESVQVCVTSPPYWGLRRYGTNPQVWGGDPGCRHEWGESIRTPWANNVAGPNGGVKNGVHSRNQAKLTGPFCRTCGAWRGELGLEPSPWLYVQHITEIFREVRRVLKADGTLWLNLGDCYATGGGKANQPGGGYRGAHDGDKKRPKWAGPYCQPNRMPIEGLLPKDLVGMPWRVAFALQEDGWILRSDIIWHKTNPMPESVQDRPTRSHENIYLLAKSQRYYYDANAVREPRVSSGSHDATGCGYRAPGQTAQRGNRGSGNKQPKFRADHLRSSIPYDGAGDTRNRRTVWTLCAKPFRGAHFATYPPALVEPCILAGSAPGDMVLDPFAGTGTTGIVALQHGRRFLGIELNPKYAAMARARIKAELLKAKRVVQIVLRKVREVRPARLRKAAA